MLNRLVDQYYWMGRSMERVENLVRMLRTFYHLQTLPNAQGRVARKALAYMIYDRNVAEAPCMHTPNGLFDYLFHPQMGNSLLNAVKQVRTNLFAVRNRMPNEMWDIINRLYLDLTESTVIDVVNMTPDTFLRNVLHRMLSANGLLTHYMMQDCEWNMLETGRLMERMEHTVRLHRVMLLTAERTEATDEWRWQGMLETLGGVESYRSVYLSRFKKDMVASFVFLNERFPRSVYRSVNQLESHIRKLHPEDSDISYVPSSGLRVVEQIRAALVTVDFERLSATETLEWLEHFWSICLRINQVINKESIPLEGVGA